MRKRYRASTAHKRARILANQRPPLGIVAASQVAHMAAELQVVQKCRGDLVLVDSKTTLQGQFYDHVM